MTNYILNDRGEPVPEPDLFKWAAWMEKRNPDGNWRIARTAVGESEVSTVFLGLDHYFGSDPNHAPVLFETMVFGGPLDQEQERYCTRAEAEVGHAAMVERVRQAQAEGTQP